MKKKIEELNHYLLTNYRLVWETKLIFLLLYLIPSYLFVSAICLAYPVSLTDYWTDYEDFTVFLTVCVSIVNSLIFLFWIHKNSQYRIERDFGFNFKFIEQSRFLLYFAGISLLVIQPFLPSYILNQKIDGLVSFEELSEDITKLNEGNIYFPTDILEYSTREDNVFESAKVTPAYENNYNGNYRYSKSYFGNPEMLTEEAVEEARFESNETTEEQNKYFQKLIDEALTDQQAIQKIQAYIELTEKYTNSLNNTTLEPKQVFESFQKQETEIGNQIGKDVIRDNIRTIIENKQQIGNSENVYILLSLLLGAFCLTTLVQIGKHIGLKNFLLSIVFNIGLSMVLGFISALIGFGGFGGMFTPLFAFAFLLFQMLSIPNLKTKQNLKVISLSTLQVYSPFFLFYLLSMAGFNSMSQIDFSVFSTITIIFGGIIYVAFFLPFFRKLHLRLQALPKE